jgi:capsular exopolysaccharide synthesis family protein
MSMEMNERSSWGSGGSDLRREVRVLWAHRWLVVTTAAILIGLAAAYTFLRTPIYTATATVFIKPTGISSSDLAGADIGKLISPETEVAIATSEEVALKAKQKLGSDATTETLLKHVSVNVPIGSQIMEINYSDPMKQKAADGANAFAAAYLDYREGQADDDVAVQQKEIETQINDVRDQITETNAQLNAASTGSTEARDANAKLDSLDSQMGLLTAKQLETFGINTDPGDVVSPAIPPTAPSSPNHELDLALGLFLGLFAGVGLAFLKHRTDNRLRERQQLEVALGAPVLSMIPRVEGWRNRDEAKLITVTDPLSPAAEAYRVLRPVLLAAAAKRGVKVVMVLSPMAGEGKSTTAANLAVVLAQSGRSVALITADLRRPRSHEFFEVASEPGLSEFLGGTAALADVERRVSAQVGGDLVIYPAGRLRAHPAELLQSRQMQRFLEDQRETFDFLILDCPPVLAVSDALPLIPLSDGVLFVADAESTTREQVSLARDRLLQMGANLLGAVINGLSGSSSGYYDDRYAYTYQPTNPPTNGNGSGSKRSRRVAKRSGTEG